MERFVVDVNHRWQSKNTDGSTGVHLTWRDFFDMERFVVGESQMAEQKH